MSSLTAPSRRAASARENAQKSTGPRTRAGKARSARNATTHAIFCQDLLHESESPELFHALRHAFLEDLNPQTALELALADRVVAAQWRLRRCLTAEARLLNLADADLAAEVDDHNDRAQRLRAKYADHAPGAADDDDAADAELARLAAHPDFDPIDPFDRPLSPGLHLARALHASATGQSRHTTTPFERLVATEQRLQGMLHRALKELRAAQAARRARAKGPDADAEPPCPFLPATATPPRHTHTRVQPAATQCNPPQPTPKLQNEPKCQPGTPAPPTPSESESSEPESEVPTPTRQSAPNPATTCHPNPPAQNEPTSSSPSVPSVTPWCNPSPPAQIEPTPNKGQGTTDQAQTPAITFSPPDFDNTFRPPSV